MWPHGGILPACSPGSARARTTAKTAGGARQARSDADLAARTRRSGSPTRAGGSMRLLLHVRGARLAQPFDLVLDLQFLALEFHDLQIIHRGMTQAFADLLFECPMLPFQFRKVRLQRHAHVSSISGSSRRKC